MTTRIDTKRPTPANPACECRGEYRGEFNRCPLCNGPHVDRTVGKAVARSDKRAAMERAAVMLREAGLIARVAIDQVDNDGVEVVDAIEVETPDEHRERVADAMEAVEYGDHAVHGCTIGAGGKVTPYHEGCAKCHTGPDARRAMIAELDASVGKPPPSHTGLCRSADCTAPATHVLVPNGERLCSRHYDVRVGRSDTLPTPRYADGSEVRVGDAVRWTGHVASLAGRHAIVTGMRCHETVYITHGDVADDYEFTGDLTPIRDPDELARTLRVGDVLADPDHGWLRLTVTEVLDDETYGFKGAGPSVAEHRAWVATQLRNGARIVRREAKA